MNLFPFPTIRSGQSEFLDDARRVISSGKHLLAHAPTGIGKTAAALAASLEYGMDNGLLTLFLTSRQSQHRIAIDTLRLMKDVSGRNIIVVDIIAKQSMCPRGGAQRLFSGEFHEFCAREQRAHRCKYATGEDKSLIEDLMHTIYDVDSLVRLATACEVCPYKTALELGGVADVIVCDYNYLFSPVEDTILARLGKGLDELIVIVDEAHNLPDRIRDHLSDSISIFDLKDAIKESKTLKGNEMARLTHHLRGMTRIFDAFGKQTPVGGEIMLTVDDLVVRVDKILKEQLEPLDFDAFVRLISAGGEKIIKDGNYHSALEHLAAFLKGWPANEGASVRIFENKETPRISNRLLDPSILARGIFDHIHASILMSGTLYPEMIRDILGIEAERSILATYRSPFPKKNRIILSVPGTTTLYSKRDEMMYAKIGTNLNTVADIIPGNLAVFFPSYMIMNAVLQYLRSSKRIVREDRGMSKEDKDGMYDLLMHLKEEDGGILVGVMGGSFAEGIDYAANALDGVVIVGIPLSPPSIEVKSLIEYYNKKFGRGHLYGYTYPAMNKVLQAAGRCIRSEEDRGAIILMDDRFGMQKYLDCLPPDFRVIISDEWAEMLKEFFYQSNQKLKD
ncbi:MAG: DNA repair helicase [Candidatus Syntrophoarchaeum caldarius]|uniref:DNA repair helicase n=1 Tax=Candidatus Syntropharchaeum caldarium TaxID=1838285 RepID=A0A1F2P837_9EURY|nr:MAG: DNA repair helicase [Candidatus Syntrophoarchaeum caldarius]